jgi:hypothetical protein
MALGDNETVRYDILIEAKSAIQSLQTLMRHTDSNAEKILRFSNIVQQHAKQWGMSWQQALNVYKQLNAELSKSKQGTLFGKTGGQDLFKGTANYLSGLEQANRLQTQVGTSAEQMGDKIEKAGHRGARGIDVIRTALGVLVSMLIFQVIQAFSQMVSMALKGLTEIEAAMFNIVNAEKRLSEQGIEISVEGLQQLIEDLQSLDPLLSKFQATELISTLATKVAPALGLGQTEIESLSKSIAILSVRNQELGKSFEEVEQQVITGLLSGKVTAGINQLGLKITDQIVMEEALRLGLVATTDAYKNLNAKEQERINALSIISILEQNTAQEVESLPQFLQTASGLIGVAKAEFQDLLTTLGQKFAPVLKEIFRGVIQILDNINTSLTENEDAWNVVVTVLTIATKAFFAIAIGVQNLVLRIGELGVALAEIVGKLPIIGTIAQKLFGNQAFADTPTSATASPFNESEAQASGEKYVEAIKKAEDDVADAMQDARDKRLDIERDYQNKLQDIARDYSNKLTDIARDTERKREDALRDYNLKVEDINRDTAESVAEAQEDARQKELDREREHQQKLKELREKFLFDLEDALRERDARQVLRLIRQFKMDKQNLEEKRKLDEEESQRELAEKVQDLERDKQLKLEAARREYEEKLVEIKIGEQREREEAATWRARQLQDARINHNRQLQENREFLQRKLRDIAEALAAELQINQSAAQALTSMWASAYSALGNNVQQLGNVLVGSAGSQVIGSGAVTTWNGGDWGGYSPGNVANIPGFAEGGSLIATRPTQFMAGERGAERIDVTPLSGRGNNVGKIFGDRSAMGDGMGGSLDLSLTLSPDLEARIIDTSLENVALHFEKLDRSK